jgi:hypothetical protein
MKVAGGSELTAQVAEYFLGAAGHVQGEQQIAIAIEADSIEQLASFENA